MKKRLAPLFVAALAIAGITTGSVPSRLTPGSATAFVGVEEAAAATPVCTWVRTRPTDNNRRALVPVVSTSNNSADCVLRRGNDNTAVATLQFALRHCWGENINVDGVFGGQTEAAVLRVQGKMGVSRDGIWGRKSTTSKNARWLDGTNPLSCGALVPGF